MQLAAPITLTPPPFVNSKGERKTYPPVRLSELDVTIVDNAKARRCMASILRCPRPITLWEGSAYDAAGDYTQAQAEARLLQVLGPDLKAGLEALFVRHA